ncbi:diguanylate cyclase [Roseisolibacter sp. H3M3-2]|uniref:diguanylate cyclase domain-containing protein n=1 Tax=Roseisolibacter sp. H3M3-2 TaxID=3031323 RepID=UPI0023DCCE73|nr:diguanylate cyclase [Roseisolibacter sp. H3M3-2]MDF1504703.1 diguanylate cyclase [Roseisolibacter sp. H3M3-2]
MHPADRDTAAPDSLPTPPAPRGGWGRAMLLLGAAATLVAGAGAIAVRDLRQAGEAQQWVRHTRDVLAAVADAEIAVDRAETAQRGYLLVDDTAYLRTGAAGGARAAGALATLRRLTRDNATQARRLDVLERLVPRRLDGLAQTVALARAGRRDSALAVVRTRRGQAESDQIRALFDDFQADEQRLLRARLDAREAHGRAALRETLLALALAVATAGWSVVLLGRLVRRQASSRERLRAALDASAASEARYRALFTALPRPAWVYDRDTLAFLAVNPAAVRQYGWTEGEFLARRITDIRPPEDAATVADAARAAGDASLPSRQWRHRWKDGTLRDVEVSTHPLAYGGHAARLCVVDDVTDRLAAERALRSREARFRAAMAGMRDAFFVLRAVERDGAVDDFEIVELNGGATRMTGVSAVGGGQASLRRLFPTSATSGILDVYRRVLATGRPYEGEHRSHDPRTRVEWVWLQVYPLDGEDGTLAVIVRDTTARKRAELRLREEAHGDPLTGLLNRRGLEDAVERRLREAAAAGAPDVLLYLDLDGFKPINDAYGHAEGDEALRAVADVLRRAVRAGDAIARLGGDEFAVYAPAGPGGDADGDIALLTQRIEHALGAADARADAAGRRYAIRTSIGGTAVRAGDTLASALARADAALYAAKAERKRGTRRAG